MAGQISICSESVSYVEQRSVRKTDPCEKPVWQGFVSLFALYLRSKPAGTQKLQRGPVKDIISAIQDQQVCGRPQIFVTITTISHRKLVLITPPTVPVEIPPRCRWKKYG